MTNENKKFKKNYIIIKKEPKEIKSSNWIDKNKFEEVLAATKLEIIGSNEFNYKNKIGEFKYIDTKDLINNIKMIQLVKQMLKRFKCIKQNKKSRNNKI